MITDASLYFGTDQTVSSTGYATNYVDCGQSLLTTGQNGNDLFVAVVCTGAYAGTNVTVKADIEDCATYNGNYAVCSAGAVTAIADVVEQPILLKLPMKHKRFLKVKYTIAGSITTAGKLTAFITESKDAQVAYAQEDGDFH